METLKAKTIVNTVKKASEWFGIDYTMNIYKGCSHGCIYCDSRSDCYKNIDFDIVKVKENALQIIRDDLRRKVKKGVISTGAMSDPYNPLEENLCLTRNALELINAFGFGVSIDTKSSLIARDIDILKDIKTHSPVIAKITITTDDDNLCSIVEPNVCNSTERFDTIQKLSDSGIFCGVLLMPILPFINDTKENIYNILTKSKLAGARFVYPSFGMTLRSGNREYFYNELSQHFPTLKEKYIKTYGNKYVCDSNRAKELWSFFVDKCNELGLAFDMKNIIRLYKLGYDDVQLKLF